MSTTSSTATGAARPAAPVLPTFESFLAWARQADARAEWIAGEVIAVPPASLEHQDVLAFLYEIVADHARRHRLGRVFFAPVAMKLPRRPSGREPDLLFVATAHLDRLRETFIDGPADLVVEVVSPESDARDHGEKFVEYEAAGIDEYWLIDPPRRAATLYRIDAAGRYQAVAPAPDGALKSTVLAGLRLWPEHLWQRPGPAGDPGAGEDADEAHAPAVRDDITSAPER